MGNSKVIRAIESSQKEREIQFAKAINLIATGVLVRDPNRLDIRGVIHCRNDVEIDSNVVFEGEVIRVF